MEQLKKVIYTLEGEITISLFEAADEKERKRLEDLQKEREGVFHRFGDKVKIINDQPYAETYALVQDVETGEIKSVFPTRIKFVE